MSKSISFPKHLKIAAFSPLQKIKPYALKLKEGKSVYALDGYVINLLSEALKFSYEIIFTPDKSFGNETPDGNWTGMIGMVQRQDSDMAIGIIITEERSQVVDFTSPYDFSDITFVTDKPTYMSKSFAILYPFSLKLWAALSALLLLISCITYILVNRKSDYGVILLNLFGYLTGRSQFSFPKTTKSSVRLMLISWALGTLFINHRYQTELLSSLTVPSLVGIRDISDLSKASEDSSFQCHTLPGSFAYNVLSKTTDELLLPIGECVKSSKVNYMSYKELFSQSKMKKVAITSRRYLGQYQLTHFISEHSFFSVVIGIAVRKKFCCKNALDDALIEYRRFGLLQKHQRDVFFFSQLSSISSIPKPSDSTNSLTVNDLYGAFAILIIGFGLSTAVLMVEIWTCQKRKKRKQIRKFSNTGQKKFSKFKLMQNKTKYPTIAYKKKKSRIPEGSVLKKAEITITVEPR